MCVYTWNFGAKNLFLLKEALFTNQTIDFHFQTIFDLNKNNINFIEVSLFFHKMEISNKKFVKNFIELFAHPVTVSTEEINNRVRYRLQLGSCVCKFPEIEICEDGSYVCSECTFEYINKNK